MSVITVLCAFWSAIDSTSGSLRGSFRAESAPGLAIDRTGEKIFPHDLEK